MALNHSNSINFEQLALKGLNWRQLSLIVTNQRLSLQHHNCMYVHVCMYVCIVLCEYVCMQIYNAQPLHRKAPLQLYNKATTMQNKANKWSLSLKAVMRRNETSEFYSRLTNCEELKFHLFDLLLIVVDFMWICYTTNPQQINTSKVWALASVSMSFGVEVVNCSKVWEHLERSCEARKLQLMRLLQKLKVLS